MSRREFSVADEYHYDRRTPTTDKRVERLADEHGRKTLRHRHADHSH
jgi:hypothetical protein